MASKKKLKKKKAVVKKKNSDAAPSTLISKIALYFLSIILPIIFFILPANSNWLNSRPLAYAKAMNNQFGTTDIEIRKKERHGTTFLIADYACKNVPKDSWFLMPPQGYYIDQMYDYRKPQNIREPYHHISLAKIFNFHCQDLNVLTMHMDDELIAKAQYTISVNNKGNIGVIEIDTPQKLERIKKTFTYDVERATNAKAVLKILTQIQSK